MKILKSKVMADRILISADYLLANDRFDIKRFSTLFQSGSFDKSGGMKLLTVDYNGKHLYDKLPRFVRFHLSEDFITRMNFNYDDFYSYNENKDFICYQYCEELLKILPESKKIKKLMKEIKDKIPEYFI